MATIISEISKELPANLVFSFASQPGEGGGLVGKIAEDLQTIQSGSTFHEQLKPIEIFVGSITTKAPT